MIDTNSCANAMLFVGVVGLIIGFLAGYIVGNGGKVND